MSKHKNIDRLFQEKLQNFEREPRAELWTEILDQMHPKKKTRFLPWWIYTGIAAMLILSFVFFLSKDSSKERTIVTPVITNIPTNVIPQDSIVPKTKQTKTLIEPKVLENSNSLITKNKTQKTIDYSSKKDNTKVYKNENAIAKNTIKETSKSKDPVVIETEKNSIAQTNISTRKSLENSRNKKIDSLQEKSVIALEENKALKENNRLSKWSIRPLMAFSSMMGSSSSPTDQIFSNNPTSGNISFNYGISVSYQINQKISFQTGVFSQKLNFDTERVSLVSLSGTVNDFFNIDVSESLPFFLVGSGGDTSGLSDLITNGGTVVETNAVLNQAISYIEIPFEFTFEISKSRKLNSSFITGFSSLFLDTNQVTLRSNITGDTTIGSSKNLNPITFSGNVGVNLDYKIQNKLFLSLNPMFKVHLNTFSRDRNGYIPVFFGVYSGLKYQF